MQRIPISLIAGFLGSGKTSLINEFLGLAEAAGTAVVVNEFGEIGLDHDLLVASDDKVVLLANGCFCCAVRGDLVAALDKLYCAGAASGDAAFGRVVIEASGLADASPVIHMLLAEPSITARYRLERVVTVVDAINGDASLDQHLESVKQLAVADQIVLSKTDLLGADAKPRLEALRQRIRGINPRAPLVDARGAGSDWLIAAFTGDAKRSAWLGAEGDGAALSKPPGRSSGHDQRFTSFCYVRDEPMSEEALLLLLQAIGDNLGPQLLRIKGIVNVAESPDRPAVIHGAQKILHALEWLERWPSVDHRTRIVFITLDAGQALVEELIALADLLAARTARARLRASA